VRRLQRFDFPDPTFSGWVIFSGSETAEYKSDPNNLVPVVQAALFDRYRVLDSGMDGPVRTTMIWNAADAEYQADAE
jgi:hypothetical protein